MNLFFFFLTLQKRSSERLRNLLKANSKDATQDIQHELFTEVMASENRHSQRIVELVYIQIVSTVSC